MEIQKVSVLKIKHGKDPIIAVLQQNGVVWQALGFDSKELAIYKPKESYCAEVGDVLFVDKDNNKELYSRYADFDLLKEEGYRPIAIVGIPGKFNVYGDCSVFCIGLNYISEKNPEEGNAYEDETGKIKFNTQDSSYSYGSEFFSENGVAIVDDRVSKVIKGFYDQPILPSDYWAGSDEDYVSSNDGIGYYLRLGIGNNSNTTNRAYSPSPYYRDQSQQELWWYSTASQPKTSQTNFNGEELTNLYLEKFSDNPNRIHLINLLKQYNPQNSDTAGEWFLGATGEMGMMICRVGVINSTITKLKLAFGYDCAAFFQSTSLNTANTNNQNSNGTLSWKCIGMKSVVISNSSINNEDYLYKPAIKFENTSNKVRININWNTYLDYITLNGRIYYQWTKVDHIEMPIGSILQWSIEMPRGYLTEESLEGVLEISEETTLGINNAHIMVPDEYTIESYEAKVGDYLFITSDGAQFLAKQNSPLEDIKELGCTPIAVVVTPGSHNVHGDCSVSCMGLNFVDSGNVNGSTSGTALALCTSASNSIPLPYYEGGLVINGPEDNTPFTYVRHPTIPSDDNSLISSTNPLSLDGVSRYADAKIHQNNDADYGTIRGYAPSPYDAEGNPNPIFWYVDSAQKLSCLRDFDGYGNTQTVIKIGNNDKYPAAKYVVQYCPKNAEYTQGKWYGPSAGEGSYLLARYQKIKDSLKILKDVFSDVSIVTDSSADIRLSTIQNNERCRNGSFGELFVIGTGSSTGTALVRPFIKFENTSDKVKINLDFSSTDNILINNRHYYSWDNINEVYVKKGTIIKYKIGDSDETSILINNETTLG